MLKIVFDLHFKFTFKSFKRKNSTSMPSGYVKLTGGDVLATKSYLLVKNFFIHKSIVLGSINGQSEVNLQLYLYQIF